MRRPLSILICLSLITSSVGCASAGRTPVATGPAPSAADSRAMADYVQRLPAGSRVRVERADGSSLRGTLMSATDDKIIVQKNTRIPEPAVAIPVATVARVTVDGGSGGVGKAVAIGIASGVGVFFAILAIAIGSGG
jgi:hypothetical protein